MNESTPIAIEAGRALDVLAAIALLLSARTDAANAAILSADEACRMLAAINEAADGLKRVVAHEIA